MAVSARPTQDTTVRSEPSGSPKARGLGIGSCAVSVLDNLALAHRADGRLGPAIQPTE